MTGADLLLKALQKHQVDTVFGYPGGAIMPIYDALYRSDIEHYLCRHEQGAAFAALGYARSKLYQENSFGVCMATSGPGATNLLTGLADAMADSVAVVAITGQVASHALGSDAFQEVDIVGMSLAITKHSFQITCAEEIPEVVDRAIALATSGRPGPVLIDIPKDFQIAQVSMSLDEASNDGLTESKMTTSATDFAKTPDYQLAGEMIKAAKQPVLYVGAGVAIANANKELADFIDYTRMPCVSTLKALGSVHPETENYLGMLGMHGNKAANLAVQKCDLLVCVGARFDDRVTGKLAEFAPNAKVVHLDIDAAEIDKRRIANCKLTGHLKQTLPKLNAALSETLDSYGKEILTWRNHCRELITRHKWRYDHPSEAIYAPAMLNKLSEALPKHAVVTTDVGQHQMWAAQHMSFEQPSDFLTSGGLGTMGFGLPAAIGAQLARPDDTVVAVTGDGSFMMNVQELGTIKRFNLPVKIVLIDNERLGMVRQWQQLFFEQRYSETTLTDNPDFPVLAQAFDIKAKTITEKAQVEQAIYNMLNHNGPYLLHVCIDEMENVWPLVPPETANHRMMEAT